jgi:hypothetical protein
MIRSIRKETGSFLVPVICIGLLSMVLSCGMDYKTYTDAKTGFSLKYPAAWESEDPHKTGISIIFKEPRGSDANRYTSNIVVMTGETPADFSSESLKNFSIEAMKGYVGKFIMIEEKKINANKTDGFLVVYEGEIAGNKIHNTQVFFARQGFAYSLLVSVPVAEYMKYSEITDKAIGSFEFKKTAK